MIRALVISPDTAGAAELERSLAALGSVAVVRKLDSYPADHALVRVIRAHAPQLVFVDTSDLPQALAAIAALETQAAGAHIIAAGRAADQPTLLALMRSGVREFVPFDAEPHELAAAVHRATAVLESKPAAVPATEFLFSFLPAKPGAGATTVAVNSAVALGRLPDVRVLLADFDLSCGMVGFSLHVDGEHSITEAAEHAPDLDEQLWSRLVAPTNGIDVLPAGRMQPGFRIEPAQIRYLLEFARRNYSVICADLSGLMERYSVEVMQESKYIFLVCTPELPSIYLARQKTEFLRSLDLEDRIRLVLNRTQRNAAVSETEVEKIVGLNVAVQFPNDYRGVYKALREGKPVEPGSELGRRFFEAAHRMLSREPNLPPVRRFVDYFALTPARFHFEK